MPITPFLNAPTVTSTKSQSQFDFVLYVSASSGPFTLENISVNFVQSGSGGTSFAAPAAVGRIDVKAPWQGTNIIADQTASYAFSVTPFGPISGIVGANNVAGTSVYGVSCVCRESTTPAIVSSNTVWITASSVSP